MADRITLTDTVYMNLDGQWRIVYGGSTIDVPDHRAFSNKILLTEAAGTLTRGAVSVRNVRTR